MFRLKGFNFKTGVVIFIFSLLLATIFSSVLFWFEAKMDNQIISSEGIYVLQKNEFTEIIENGGTLNINTNQLLKEKDYQSQLLNHILSTFLPMVFVFVFILFILSTGLWYILKRMQNKETLKIIQDMNFAIKENISSKDPALNMTYGFLKQSFDDQLNDYKRLNSYLSHEQKNAIALLRTQLELSNHKEYLNHLDDITDSIDDILTLSENEDMSILEEVDISLVCAKVCDTYKKSYSKITFDFNENEEPIILAKYRWIYRAVANLLDNAIKYGNHQPIHVLVEVKKKCVIISVKDNGIGIGIDKQDQIFNNRFRVNELNKDGYGIGLSLVSHVCDLCGGFVMLDSKIGQGSTFYISFPQKLI